MTRTAPRFKTKRIWQRGRECDVCGQRIEAFQHVDSMGKGYKVQINGHDHCIKRLKADYARSKSR